MFSKLVKNELVKQFKQKGVMITGILLLILAIALPVGINSIQEMQSNTSNLMETDRPLEILRAEMDDTPETAKEIIQYIINKVEEDYLVLAQEIKLEFADWRNDLIAEYKESLATLSFLEAIKGGISIEDILINGYNFNYTEIENVQNLSESAFLEKIEAYKRDVALYRETILKDDYVTGITLYIQALEETVEENTKRIQDIKQDNDLDTEEREIAIRDLEASIKLQLANKEVLTYRLAENIAYDKADWKNQVLLELEVMNGKLHESIMPERDFYNYKDPKFETYEHYLETINIKNRDRQDRIDLLWNALETNTPPIDMQYDARILTYVTVEFLIMLATLFIIFIGGGIIASEFSRGSIRMLLSRPVNRGKIYLAKCTMLLSVGFGLIIVGSLLAVLTSGVLVGFDGFGIASVTSSNGTILTESFFSYLVEETVLSTGGLIGVIGLIMLLSTVTKSTVVTVGSMMALYMIAAPLSGVLASLDLVRYTILPYLNIGVIRLFPVIGDNFWAMGINLNLQAGFIGMIIFAIIATGVGYIVFVKKDVKN